MGRVEMMILVVAIAILGRFSLTVNDALANNEIHVIQSEYELNSISIVESLFRQAWVKSFDEAAVSGSPAKIPSDFTAAEDLGPESGETYPAFDDIDDFNALSLTDTADNGMVYTLNAVVGYVDQDDKNTMLTEQTTLKRMNVTLSSDYLEQDITLSRIYPYWK